MRWLRGHRGDPALQSFPPRRCRPIGRWSTPAAADEIPTLVRVPAKSGVPEVEMRLYPWLVSEPPADAAGDVLGRLAATNVLGLAAAHSDDAEPCPDRAMQFFVFGKPARAIHLTNAAGQRIVVTAGESARLARRGARRGRPRWLGLRRRRGDGRRHRTPRGVLDRGGRPFEPLAAARPSCPARTRRWCRPRAPRG